MASKVDICNMALSRLASDRITALTDGTRAAKECNFRYDIIADMVMAAGAWPSVINRATLAQSATTPEYGFSYQYQLPTDPKCLRVLTINETALGDNEYKIEKGFLLTDLAEVSIKYIGRVENTEDYDTHLMLAIIEALCADLAYTFTGQATVAEKMVERAEKKVQDLLNQASLQGSSEEIPSDTFIDIRR